MLLEEAHVTPHLCGISAAVHRLITRVLRVAAVARPHCQDSTRARLVLPAPRPYLSAAVNVHILPKISEEGRESRIKTTFKTEFALVLLQKNI